MSTSFSESFFSDPQHVLHDINNAITVILSIATSTREKNTDPHIKKGMKTIESMAERISLKGKSLLPREAKHGSMINMHLFMNDACETGLMFVGAENKVSINNSIDRDHYLHGNKLELQDAIINLMLNSVHAMRGFLPGVDRIIKIRAESINNTVVITVQDCGCGIDKDVIGKVFDPFYTTKGGEGHGIGLCAVRNCIEQHHGAISIESEDGNGALVTITLPVHRHKMRSVGG